MKQEIEDIEFLIKMQRKKIKNNIFIITVLVVISLIFSFFLSKISFIGAIISKFSSDTAITSIVGGFFITVSSGFPSFKDIRERYDKVTLYEGLLKKVKNMEKKIVQLDENEINKIKILVAKITEKLYLE
jgi:cell shape-determining protein MreC